MRWAQRPLHHLQAHVLHPTALRLDVQAVGEELEAGRRIAVVYSPTLLAAERDVLARERQRLAEADAMKVIGGYTLMNDVTARDLQTKDGQWARAKGFDTFAPVGPAVVAELDPTDLEIQTLVNGQVVQRGRTSQLIFPIPRLIAYLSRFCTLEPGDLISTGTPSGVGPLRDGDTVEVRIPGIGSLINPVVNERQV
jgi:2-keto-4-pentenoate hydratase/2-oxohepta-3-ene-1,7-dioic acid hydratase in catechol pathway